MAIQKRVDYFGASVAGPAHRVARKLNEDRWLGASGSFGSLIVVSDGLGSKPQARRGAQAACTATLRAVRSWFSEGGGSFEQLLPRIEAFWLEEIAPHDRTDCAATCLMALAHRDGGSYVAALGDGMAAVRSGRAVDRIEFPRGSSAFSNETMSLGGSGTWASRRYGVAEVDAVVLASDGVSDDLRSDRIADFIAWLTDDIAPLQPQPRWRQLCRELHDWPTPRHLDDKTLAVLTWRPAEAV
jgi:serine/threonine protein phosphatase PrpC